MNLIVDIGNNSAKFYLFKDNKIILHGRKPCKNLDFIEESVKEYAVENVIISSVANIDNEQRNRAMNTGARTIWFDNTVPVDLKIDYRTPETLGSDRIAAAMGAMHEAPGRNLLIIDAGSAITIDFIDSEGHFKGGNISPGVKMRLTALHKQTARLPLVEKDGETPSLGYDTETAIRSGVIRGICYEIDGYINQIKEKYPDVLIFLTGGDEKTLIYNIKNRIFADKFLIAKGLNKILGTIYGNK